MPTHVARGAALLWALPCSLIGAALGLPCLLAGGSVRRVGSHIEVSMRREPARPGSLRSALPFVAITFGHVIVGQCPQVLARLRPHELAHVRQYECWGPLFLIAYPLASVEAWWRGQGAYRGNRFEREARAAAARSVEFDRAATAYR